MSDFRGPRPTKTCTKCGEDKDVDDFYEGRADCKECKKLSVAPISRKHNPRRNAISRLAYRIAGSIRKFYALPKDERLDIRETARRMYEAGIDYGTAVTNELTNREGFLYVITNPAWPGCVKLGRAFNPHSRLNGYQTGCPHRDYQLHHSVYFTDCHEAEQAVHARLAHLQLEGEWFALSVSEAMNTLDVIKEII